MGETQGDKAEPAAGRRLPAWIRFTALMLLLIAVGIAVWALVADRSRTRSGDMGAVRELSIVASNFRSWPETAHQVAQTNLFHAPAARSSAGHGEVDLFHPAIGRFAVDYVPAPAGAAGGEGGDAAAGACVPRGGQRCVTIADGRMSVRGVALGDAEPNDPYQARRVAQQRVLPPGTTAIHYAVRGIPLEKVLTLPPTFEHLLIVEGAELAEAKEGRLPALKVVAQVGRPELPIRSLNELPLLRDQTVDLADAANALLPDTVRASPEQLKALLAGGTRDALVPVDSRIAGKAYRLYLYPVSIADTGRSIDYYVVGVKAEEGGLFDVALGGAPALAFGFALAILLALSPIIKLAFLGPVDGLRRLELFAIIAGCLVAGAMATASVVLALDVMRGRADAMARMEEQAQRLAGAMHGELKALLARPMPTEAELMRPDPRHTRTRGGIVVQAGRSAPDIPQPNTLFLLDGRGHQALDTPIIALRDQPGADWDVSDRGYFNRALLGELDAGTAAVAAPALAGRCRTLAGFVVDQVRSRPDGVAKTVVATPLQPDSVKAYRAIGAADSTLPAACEAARLQAAGSGRVWVTSFVMQSMLRPDILPGSGYAVVDMGDAALPVLFHSRSGRAHVEVLRSGLDPAALQVVDALRARPANGTGCARGVGRTALFEGRYNGTLRQFALAEVPCTRWAVVSFVDRDQVDMLAARAVRHAAIGWLGFAFLGGVLIGLAMLFRPQRGWRKWDWLWPAEGQSALYGRLAAGGAAAAAAGLGLVALRQPLAALALVAVGVAAILWRLSRPATPVLEPLGDETGRRFRLLMLAMLGLLAVVPVVGLASDARLHLAGVDAAGQAAAHELAKGERQAAAAAIVRVFRADWRDRPLPAADRPKPVPCGEGPLSITAEARRLVLGQADCWLMPDGRLPRAVRDWPWLLGLGLLAAGLAGLLVVAVRSIGRGLFGFGVALEAVEHPRFPEETGTALREVRLAGVRPCFMAIGAPSWVRASLMKQAGDAAFDLFDLAANPQAAQAVQLPKASMPPKLLLFHDFELLQRDPAARAAALELIERMLEAQKGQPEAMRCRIGLMADMSPLDRFLQSSEHREAADEDMRAARWKSGEDIRWSRILEQFTNYVYRAEPRAVVPPDLLAQEPAGIRLVVEELAYLPDHVVEAIIPDMTAGLSVGEIVSWAKEKRLDARSEAAVVDYLASQLIEHYHYLWSVSSRAEQILIYRFAHGQLVNIAEAYALRSLVRRGIVVLDPVPRIVNRSFAQFVRHVEEPKRLAIWQANQPDGLWTRLRAPLTFVLPLTLALVVLVLAEGSGSLATTIPFLLAAGPALLNVVGGLRRSFG